MFDVKFVFGWVGGGKVNSWNERVPKTQGTRGVWESEASPPWTFRNLEALKCSHFGEVTNKKFVLEGRATSTLVLPLSHGPDQLLLKPNVKIN